MAKEIKGCLYKVEFLFDYRFVECKDMTELFEYLSDRAVSGDDFYGVNEIRLDGSTPRVAVKTIPEYKKILKEKQKNLKREEMV